MELVRGMPMFIGRFNALLGSGNRLIPGAKDLDLDVLRQSRVFQIAQGVVAEAGVAYADKYPLDHRAKEWHSRSSLKRNIHANGIELYFCIQNLKIQTFSRDSRSANARFSASS
jgi:hypothetical protein